VAVHAIIADIRKRSRTITTNEEISQVATISANGGRGIGKLVAQAMERVGIEGVITVEEARSLETELEVVEGMELWLHQSLLRNQRREDGGRVRGSIHSDLRKTAIPKILGDYLTTGYDPDFLEHSLAAVGDTTCLYCRNLKATAEPVDH
jgi:hypothetical protein